MIYRPEIDGLRALAVLPVILFHAGFSAFSGGYVGVDVFFVISGYLITSIIIYEIADEKFTILNFYERRARRILPALFFVMAACIPFAWFWFLPEDLIKFSQSLIAVSAFASNILFWKQSGYFAGATELMPLLHTWSLAVEEQYYILFPIFLMIAWRLGLRFIIVTLAFIFLFSLMLADWASVHYPSPNFYLLPTRAWELLIGVFIAFNQKYNNFIFQKTANQILSVVGFLMIFISIIAFDDTTPFPSFYALVPTIGTGLIILFAVKNTVVNEILSSKYLVGIGLISYSAYLWHQPILAFSRYRFGDEITSTTLILLCLAALVMAWISWRYVEKPFRDKKKTSKKTILIFSLSGIIFFVGIGALIIKNSGFENRNLEFKEYSKSLYWPSTYNRTEECIQQYGGDQYCLIADSSKPVSMLLIGDSHANHFFAGLSEYLKKDNENLLMLGAGGCPPILDIDMGIHYEHGVRLRCLERMNDLYKDTFLNNKINRVYLSFAQHTLFDSRLSFIDSKLEIDFSSNRLDAAKKSIIRTIEFFKENGSEVIIIEDLPDSSTEEFLKCLFWSKDISNCKNKLRLKKGTKEYEILLNSLQSEGVKILRTKDALSSFPFVKDSSKTQNKPLLYRDNTHLSEKGSIYVITESYTEYNELENH